MTLRRACALLVTAAYLGGASADEYPVFDEPSLRAGRDVWLETCLACHTTDLAGAPQVTDAAAWTPRLKQGREVLYQHALSGFHGEQGTEMPARGGNAALTDDEVRAAVDYMLALVSNFSGDTP